MKKLLVFIFLLFSFNTYALDVSLFKDAKCENINMGNTENNVISNMYNCTYENNITFYNVYYDVIDMVGKEILSQNKFKSSKSKSSFESSLNNLISKKYDEYVLKEEIKDGIVYIVVRSMEQSVAEISTNMAVMDEYYSFIIMKENNIIKLIISSFKGDEYIEANKTFVE